MDNRRFMLLAVFGVILFFMYQSWQKDYIEPAHAAALATAQPSLAIEDDLDVPTSRAPVDGDIPNAVTRSAATTPSDDPSVAVDTTTRIHVETDLVRAEIAVDGGDLRRLELKNYPISKDQPDQALSFMDDRGGRLFVLQSGLASTGEALMSHRTPLRAPQLDYRLAEGQDHVDVVLERQTEQFTARKIYRFHRGSYQIELIHELDNHSDAALTVSPYARLQRTEYKTLGEPPFVRTFTGVGFYEQKNDSDSYRYVKTALEKVGKKPVEAQQQGGWIAMLQHYFVAAIIPPQSQNASFSSKAASSGGYLAQVLSGAQTVEAGDSAQFVTELYLGPKLQNAVSDVAPGFDLTLDYGILTPLSKPLFWLLALLHHWVGNWGLAIIILTLIVKGAMYKLSEAQYRSMAKMKKFGPKIQSLKERFGDDREKLQKAMMELYKKEGFNPLAGCWPMLVQFPVFIALYWVLIESVELRQAPFMLWLQDLTAPDPFYVLPILFGVSMFLQQRLSGHQAADPLQQKIMHVMPIGLTAFFAFFQSGLVLYWFTSNLIGLVQQWVITRKIERDDGVAVKTRR